MIEVDRASSSLALRRTSGPSIERPLHPDAPAPLSFLSDLVTARPPPAQRSTTSPARPRPRTISTTPSRRSRRRSWVRSTCSASPSASRPASSSRRRRVRPLLSSFLGLVAVALLPGERAVARAAAARPRGPSASTHQVTDPAVPSSLVRFPARTQRSTATPRSTPSPRTTGATSTRSARARATTRASVLPRSVPCPLAPPRAFPRSSARAPR